MLIVLILSRRWQESLILTLPDGRTIKVLVVEIGRSNVRLGIDAPDDVDILRSELLPVPPGKGVTP